MGTQLSVGMRTLTAFLLVHRLVIEAGGCGSAGTQHSCTELNRDDVRTDILYWTRAFLSSPFSSCFLF